MTLEYLAFMLVSQERTFRDLSTRGDVSFALCHYYGESSSEFPEESPHRLWALVACASDNDPDHLITRLIANLKSSSTEEQKKAALDVKSLAKNNSENRLKIAKAGAIMPLISLLISSSDLQLQEYAVTAILNLSLCDENKELITSSGAINPLVQALMTGNRTTKENAACALHHLSLVEEKKIEIGQSGAIPLLVNLLEHGESQGKKDAMMALCTLCSVKENKIQAIRVGIMKLLVAFMADFNSILLDMSVCMVSVLVSEPEAGTALVEERGIPVVVKILWSGFPRQKETAVKVLLHICEISVTYRALLVQEDAIFPLLQLSRSTTSVKQEAETLIELLRQPRSRNTAAAAKQDNQ